MPITIQTPTLNRFTAMVRRNSDYIMFALYIPLFIFALMAALEALKTVLHVGFDGVWDDGVALIFIVLPVSAVAGITSYTYATLMPEAKWKKHPIITSIFFILGAPTLLLACFFLSVSFKGPFNINSVVVLLLLPLILHAAYKCYRFIRLVVLKKPA